MAVSIPVKYIVTTKDALDNVPIIEGQVICLADQDGWYYDMGGERRETTGEKYNFVNSDTIEIIITPIEDNKFQWQARVKEGSITEKELEEYRNRKALAQIQVNEDEDEESDSSEVDRSDSENDYDVQSFVYSTKKNNVYI